MLVKLFVRNYLNLLKISKKFKEELKLANPEKEEFVVRLDESNKNDEFLRNQISSQDEKMKSLEQELVESRAKIKNLTCTKFAIDNKSVSVSFKPKTEKVCIPHFKMNNKEKKAYFARLEKGKSFDVDAKVSKPTVRKHNKSVFVPTCHFCGVVGHIRPNCSLLRQKPKFETRFVVRNIDVPKFVHVCHFYGVSGHIRPNYHKLKFKNSVFQSRICGDISPIISPYKLFHILLRS